jgi:tyrosyl-tRNA synthetase
VVQSGEVPEQITIYPIGIHSAEAVGTPRVIKAEKEEDITVDITKVLVKANIVKSRGEAKRLLAQSAIEVDGNIVLEKDVKIKNGSVIQVGKRRFLKISITKTAA